MSLWENLRDETVGLLRSIGYDLRRRIGRGADDGYPEYDAYARRPRRALLGGGIAVLAVGGVAGTYFALAGGLGGWLLGTNPTGPNPASPPQTPVVTSATPSATPQARSAPEPAPSTSGLPPIVITTGQTGAGRTSVTAPSPAASHRAISTPGTPPTTTPAAPPTSPAPSPSTSPAPSDPPTSSSPDPSASPSPSDSVPPSDESYSPPATSAALAANMRSVSTFVPTGA